MKMQNDKLLPCPFCGGEAETTFICDGRYNQIKCKTPKCIMNVDMPAFYKNKEEAIKTWNTRKPMERFNKKLKEELKCVEKEVIECLIEAYKQGMNDMFDIIRNGKE
jgi:hypothetical protein